MNSKTEQAIWHRSSDADGIVTLSFDLPNSSTNILNADALIALSIEVDQLMANPPRGLIIRSAKRNGFIAGADVTSFAEQESIDSTFAAIRQVQQLFNHIEELTCPTVAVIHGFCLGGGLELALACDYRLAEDNPNTQIGLPEVKLGIHPGYGGSVRLTERIGVIPAMTMMLTGRSLSARAAKRNDLVDQCLPERLLLKHAVELIKYPPDKASLPLIHRVLSHSFLRPIVAFALKKQTAKKADINHYPAPFELIRLWQNQPSQRQDYFTAEALSVAQLIQTQTAQNLVRLFLLQRRLKAFAKQSDFKAKHVHVIGAGVMGGDIAAWCALKGLNVTLQDQSPERIAPAIARAHKLFKNRLKQSHLTRAAMDRLQADSNGLGLHRADVVIEAIFENLEAKQSLYQAIEPQLAEHAVLATNTSSIPLEKLSTCLVQPERLVGMHFFNPVAKMQLVEIVSAANTDPVWQQKVTRFTRQIGRLPLPVKSTPGFLVNRILMPYLLEAIVLFEEGIEPRTIDSVAKEFGMPMGPIELADTVGLDICLSVASMLAPEFALEVPVSLKNKVEQGHLGRKSGQGFYQYPSPKSFIKTKSDEVDRSLIEQRLILRLVNECVSCLDEGIVSDSDLLDAGVVFGTGFAPFRGGPMRYAQQHGSQTLLLQLNNLHQRFGQGFEPKLGWENIS